MQKCRGTKNCSSSRAEVSKVLTCITQVEVQMQGFKNTFVKVEESTCPFYSSIGKKALISKILTV